MTLFEYLAIAFSLVLSFSAMRLVAGLPYAAHPNRRYWAASAEYGNGTTFQSGNTRRAMSAMVADFARSFPPAKQGE